MPVTAATRGGKWNDGRTMERSGARWEVGKWAAKRALLLEWCRRMQRPSPPCSAGHNEQVRIQLQRETQSVEIVSDRSVVDVNLGKTKCEAESGQRQSEDHEGRGMRRTGSRLEFRELSCLFVVLTFFYQTSH